MLGQRSDLIAPGRQAGRAGQPGGDGIEGGLCRESCTHVVPRKPDGRPADHALCGTAGDRALTGLQAPLARPRNGTVPSPDSAGEILVARLAGFVPLSPDDRTALSQLARRETYVPAHMDLVHEGEATDSAFLVLEGIACRYVENAAGARQILALLLPGDLCDTDLGHLTQWDHGIAALSPCQVTRVPRTKLEGLIATHPAVTQAFRLAKLEAEARSRNWLAALGICRATERLTRVLCEILDRLHAVGLSGPSDCPLPLTQMDLAECIGTSSVHVNRTLQELRRSGTMELKGGRLRILDRAGLEALNGHRRPPLPNV